MKFDFNKVMLGLDDQPLINPGETDPTIMCKLLARRLASVHRGPVMKFYDWAKLLYGGQELNLDREDVKTLSDFVKEDDQITILAKAQLLQVLESGQKES